MKKTSVAIASPSAINTKLFSRNAVRMTDLIIMYIFINAKNTVLSYFPIMCT